MTTTEDPVVYEIVRHRLLMLTEECASTVMTTSGSPVVVFGRDFNSAVMTATGEYVFFGRNIKIHAGVMDLVVSDILASAESGLEVRDGDMFLSNDPWVGSGHQNDVVVVCPVFADGRLLFWLGNALHHMDIGGSVVGGRSSRTKSVFEEPTIFPPVRIVEGDRLRPDLARLFVRQSRLPSYEALDLRAQVAGNLVAKRRLLEMLGEFGPDAVSSIAETLVAEGGRRFERILQGLPDGEWHDEAYLDGVADGDDRLCRVAMRVVKEGGSIEFADDGSDPQLDSPVNCAFGAWRSGIICAVMSQFGTDVALSPGGALRHIRFTPEPGTLLNANHPAPVNRATGLGVGLSAGMAMRLLAEVLCGSATHRPKLAAVSGSEPLIIAGLTGRGPTGSKYFRVFTDPVACGSGAFGGGDGDATGGSTINLGAVIPNVEEYEAFGGYLYLFRREEPDTGGAGEWRGGNALSYGVVPYQVESSVANVTGWGVGFPTFAGNFGGYPATARRVELVRGCDVWRSVSDGCWPGSEEEIKGDATLLPGRMETIDLGDSDALILVSGGGGGVGDPLDRPAAMVAQDVVEGAVSHRAASLLYGVVVDDSGQVDGEATLLRQREIRARRAGREVPEQPAGAWEAPAGPAPVMGAHPAILMHEGRPRCARCGFIVGAAARSYLSLASARSVPLRDRMAVSGIGDEPTGWGASLVEVSCPGCGHLFSTNVAIDKAGA
ncbi:MAG: hydantoinase B/oxoprolinase family protein [Acidimicrobiales bacterium]|nr:hydantoinase B/oxoprolinase family protein [Acidimicrobiales bacterium]